MANWSPTPTPRTRPERGGIARLAATVAQVRAQAPGRSAVLLFAGGLLQGTLTSNRFLGLPDLVLFGRMGVDVAVMGNHELNRPVGVSARELSARRELIRRVEAPLGNFVADLAREITLTGVALFNAGGFRATSTGPRHGNA